MPLLLAFIFVPILEIAGLVLAGSLIGLLPTLGLVLLSSALGFFLLRTHGVPLIRGGSGAGDPRDTERLLAHLCLVVAGVLFLVPGLLSDVLAIVLLVPAVRQAIGGRLMEVFSRHAKVRVVLNGRSMEFGEPEVTLRPANTENADTQEPSPMAEDAPDAPRLSESRWRPSNSRYRSE